MEHSSLRTLLPILLATVNLDTVSTRFKKYASRNTDAFIQNAAADKLPLSDLALPDAKVTSCPSVTSSGEENDSCEDGSVPLGRPSIHSNKSSVETKKNDQKDAPGAPVGDNDTIRLTHEQQERPVSTSVSHLGPHPLPPESELEVSTAASATEAPTRCCWGQLNTYWAIGVGIVLVALCGAIVRPALRYEEPSVPAADLRTSDLRSQLESLFPDQTKRFYANVISVVRGVQMEFPQPTALLLTSNGSSDEKKMADAMAECLANLLERNLTGQAQATIVRGEDHRGIEHSESKYRIDEQLEAHFSRQARVALVTGIENLSLDAAKMFYKYCDHENSRHNNVIFVLTVAVHGAIANTAELSIERELLTSWSNNPDEVSPILTRVANNVILLKPLPRFKCHNV